MPHPVLINGGTSIEWAIENPILQENVIGTESDTLRTKLGNGSSYWNSLRYTDEITYDYIPKKILDFVGRIIVPGLAAANAAVYSQSGNIISVDNGTAHNIPAITYDGGMIYLAIGTVSTGVAPDSKYANFFTNFQRTGANTFTCEATNSQTGTGYVNTNTSTTTLIPLSTTLDGNIANVGDVFEYFSSTTCNNSAGAKTARPVIGGYNCASNSQTTITLVTNSSPAMLALLPNNRQIGIAPGVTSAGTLDFTTSKEITMTLAVAAANDFICLERFRVNLKKY